METNEALKKSYKLVPPDGGYGYVILVAVTLNLVTGIMFYVCFGMIFKDFFLTLGMGTTSISVVTGVRAISIAISGFLTGPLLKVLSRRKVAFIGSVFYNSGVFGSVFIETQAQFIVCQGFLQTFGLGFLYNTSCTMINDYFTEKRLLATSIMNTCAAAAGIAAPIIVTWSMAEYGFRGTLIVITAISIHNFIGSALLQPVAWHMKKEVIDNGEEEVLLQKDKDDITLSHTRRVRQNVVDSCSTCSTFAEDEPKTSGEKIATTWKSIIDWPSIKRFMRTCTCYGIPTAVFADILFVYNLAQFLYDSNWNDDQVQWSFAVVAFGDLATRVLFVLLSTWLKLLGNRLIYLIGLLIAIATKLAMLWVRDYIGTLVILGLMGISRCIIMVLVPLVVADCGQPEEFPTFMGIGFGLYGLICIVVGPIIGVIRDSTGSYTIMFLILIAIFSMIAVAWSIEMLRDFKRKTEETAPTMKEERSMSICV